MEISLFSNEDIKFIFQNKFEGYHFKNGVEKELLNWSGYFPPLLLSIMNYLHDSSERNITTERVISKAKFTIDEGDRKMNHFLTLLWDSCNADEKDLFKHILGSANPLLKSEFLPSKLKKLESFGMIFFQGNKIYPNKLFEYYLKNNKTTLYNTEALFKDEDNYKFYIKDVLERRLDQVKRFENDFYNRTSLLEFFGLKFYGDCF